MPDFSNGEKFQDAELAQKAAALRATLSEPAGAAAVASNAEVEPEDISVHYREGGSYTVPTHGGGPRITIF